MSEPLMLGENQKDVALRSYRDWQGLISSDYDRCVMRISALVRDGTYQLVFASLELLPPEVPSPPDKFCRKNFRSSTATSGRLTMSVDAGLDWYEGAWRGPVVFPTADIQLATGRLAAEPNAKRFVLSHEVPFGPAWHLGTRLHRLVPLEDPEGDLQDAVLQMTKVEGWGRARHWFEEQLHFDVFAHDDWLGSVVLLAPNPLHRSIGARIVNRDAGHEEVEVLASPRRNADLSKIRVSLQERRGTAAAYHQLVPATPLGIARCSIAGGIDQLSYSIMCPERGLLYEEGPSGFFRSFYVSSQETAGTRVTEVPPRQKAAEGKRYATSVWGKAKPNKSQTPVAVEGLYRLEDLERRRSTRFGDRQPLSASVTVEDTQLFKNDRTEAVRFIRSQIARATRRVIFIDPYFEPADALEFASAVGHQGVEISVLLGRHGVRLRQPPVNGPPDAQLVGDWLVAEMAKLQADSVLRSGSVKLKVFCEGRSFHDRFLLIDDDVWHCGHSFNKVGGGEFSAMTRVGRPEAAKELILREFAEAEDFSAFWTVARRVGPRGWRAKLANLLRRWTKRIEGHTSGGEP